MSVDIKFTQKGHLIKQDKLGKGQDLAGACPTLEGRSIVPGPSQPAPGHTIRLRHQEGEFKSQMMRKVTTWSCKLYALVPQMKITECPLQWASIYK